MQLRASLAESSAEIARLKAEIKRIPILEQQLKEKE